MNHFNFERIFTSFCLLMILLPQGDCTANDVEESSDLFEGDIAINEEEENALEHGEQEAGILGAHFRWQNHIIPYTISDEFEKFDQNAIKNAMREISEKTCIRFKPRENEKDYVHYQNGRGCSSAVGRQGTGKQAITLMIPGCVRTFGTIIHETVHAIGFWHEQSRVDRDKFVNIKWRNIDEEKKHNFNKFTSKTTHDFGVPYDYLSVMHYPASAFISPEAAKKQLKTIVPRVDRVTIGQRKGLSKLDALKINRMYECVNAEKEEGKEIYTTSTAKPVTSTASTITTTTTRTHPPYTKVHKSRYYKYAFNKNSIEAQPRMWWF